MSNRHTQSICLYGVSLDVGNQGCRALTASLIKLIHDINSDLDIILIEGSRNGGTRKIMSGGRELTVDIVNFRLSPKSKVGEHLFWICAAAVIYRLLPLAFVRRFILATTPCIRAIVNAEFVGDIRNGDSFSDLYGLKRMLIGSLIPLCVVILKKKLILLPQTYGPYKHWISREITRILFRHATAIFTRDKISSKYIQDEFLRNGHVKPVAFCPDVAFTLETEQPRKIVIDPPMRKLNSHFLIGINVSGLLFNGGYTGNNMFRLRFDYRKTITSLITMLLDITESHILLVPHVFSDGVESDMNACIAVQKELEETYAGRIHRVTEKYDQSQIKSIIGMCNFFVGSRMHSCIAALSQNIPCACIAYSRKFLGVFDSIGLESFVIDGCSSDEQRVVEKCLDLLNKRDIATQHLIHHMPVIRQQVSESFNSLMQHVSEPAIHDA